MSVKLAVGLGNMGSRYHGTRHNLGMEAVARLGKSFGVQFKHNKYCAAWIAQVEAGSLKLMLAAPEGYMNESGVNIANILRYGKIDISETAVFYDDITIESGKFKLSLGGSAGGHNGVANLMQVCGNAFMRFRLGLGGKPVREMDLADYVLGKMLPDEQARFDAMQPRLEEAFMAAAKKGFAAAQNAYNVKGTDGQNFNKQEQDT